MAAPLTQEVLQSVVDHAMRDVMPRVGGITLLRGGSPPMGELYTVHTAFDGETPVNLSLCANAAAFTHLTQHMMGQEQIAPADLEDAAKEFFNVLCGHVAVELFHVTKASYRFRIPRFSGGRQLPREQEWQFALNYSGDKDERIQIVQHTGASSDARNKTEI